MIWAIMLLLTALVGYYLLHPFLASGPSPADERLAEARAQRAAIDLDAAEGRLTAEAARQARDALDRRVLEILDAAPKAGSLQDLRSIAIFIVPAVLLLGVASIYVRIGSPAFERVSMAEYQAAQVADLPQSLDGLVVELRNRLEADPNPPADGYILLARSYLRLNQIDAALAAYDRAIEISGQSANMVAERDQVVQALQARAAAPDIDPETAARIQAMSPEEQAAMVESMVEGLAMRLEQDPLDAQGWARLIRARLVLGQMDQARADLETARTLFAEAPDQLALFDVFAAELAQTEP